MESVGDIPAHLSLFIIIPHVYSPYIMRNAGLEEVQEQSAALGPTSGSGLFWTSPAQ